MEMNERDLGECTRIPAGQEEPCGGSGTVVLFAPDEAMGLVICEPCYLERQGREGRFSVTLEMTDDGQDFTRWLAEHGITFRKIGQHSSVPGGGWTTEFASLTRASLEAMINEWWYSGDPHTDWETLSQIREAAL